MAQIQFQEKTEIIAEDEAVIRFLKEEDVIYEKWDIKKVPITLKDKYLLDDEEKTEILDAFAEEISDISNRRGYQAHDVICLSDHTPNLDLLLENFKKEHHHTDDEVRFIVSGHGIFVIEGKNGEFFNVYLEPGDLISVPENVRHYFTLQADRKVVAVRIFVTTEGWVPIYEKKIHN